MVAGQASRAWREAAVIFAAWSFFGLILANQFYMQSQLHGRPVPWSMGLRPAMFDAWVWAAINVAVFGLARRFPLERGRMLRNAAAHVVGAIVISLARILVMVEVSRHVDWLGIRSFSDQLWRSTFINPVFYALMLGFAHALLYYERYRERDLAAQRLAAGLTEARLHALKMQLQPHFLFNTLNAISALIPSEAKPARRMVARLGDLLRIALEHEDTQEVTLREELEFLQPYLEIEQARLEDRLSVTMDIAADAMDARVPHLLLQPLVENAIRHGVAPRIDPGTVTISAHPADDVLELEVRDDGPGMERGNGARTRKGVGLANVQSRLEQLYGSGHRFALENHPAGGVAVRISLPLRRGASLADTKAERRG